MTPSPKPHVQAHGGPAIVERQGFLPPVYPVVPHTGTGWEDVPPVPVFLDLHGVPVKEAPAEVRMVWWNDHVLVQVAWRPDLKIRKDSIAPGHPDFWKQDHMELRVMIPEKGSESMWQILVTPDGRWWDDQNTWTSEDPPIETWLDGRAVTVKIRASALQSGEFVEGQEIRGLVGLTVWQSGEPEFFANTAAELGFAHGERFGVWKLSPSLPAFVKWSPEGMQVFNPESAPGTLCVLQESETVESIRRPVSGTACVIPLPEPSTFPRFTRYSFLWLGERTRELGSICFRLPNLLRAPSLQKTAHPGLLFDCRELEVIRQKALDPFFQGQFPSPISVEEFLNGRSFPESPASLSLEITPACMNWFRVAKETMLRDGEGGKRASSRRLWELQSEPAKQAWRLVVSSVGRDPAALEVLLPELNRLLAMRELYQASAFENIRLPMEGRDLLAKGLSSLTQREVMRFNRILLQSSIECMKAFQMDLLFFPSACFRHWLQTPDSRLVKAATRSVHAARFSTIPDADFHLHEGMAASGLACAYDAFHTALSDSERGHWVALMKKCLGLYLESDARSAWTLTTIANANPVGNSGAGLLALALISEEPELAAQVLNSVRRNLWRWLDFCQGPDGGNTEGAQYWHYALQNFLPFALAYERVMGRDDGFLSNPSICNAMNMVRVSLTNDGGCHGTNDTVPVPVGGVVGWILASRFGDSFGLWYGDHAVRWFSERAHRDLPLAYRPSAEEMLLYRPVGPEVLSAPPFPKVLVLRSVEMGMLRSAPSHTAAFTVSVKGARPPFTHHNQADAGSFSLEFRGERLLIDPGYYKEKPTDHSLLVVDGVAPQAASSWTAALGASFEHGDLCGITMDASRAYGGRTCVRHFVLVGAEALVTLDHTDSPPTALFQCGAPTWAHPDGYAFEIHGNHAQLRVSLFPDVAVTLSPERSLKDVHWGYAFSEARWFPVAAQFAASSSGPYVTVIEEVSGASRPKVTRTHEHVEITLRSGRSLRFLNVAGAWRLLPF